MAEKLTWRELKEFANDVDEQFLDEPVVWWGEERGGSVTSVGKLEERYYNTDEGYTPESTLDPSEDPEYKYEYVSDEEDFIEKGHPIIWVD